MTDQNFSVEEAAALLDLTPSEVRRFARAGLGRDPKDAAPESGLDFRDLVVLRMAAGLRRAQVPSRRIQHALSHLRSTAGGQVARLRLEALGDHVVVRDGEVVWRADSGQLDLGFTGATPSVGEEPPRSVSSFRVSAVAAEAESAEGCLERALGIEPEDPASAIDWYRRAVDLDAELWEAHAGLGFALQQTGDAEGAVQSYRHACALEPDATVQFNLGVALDDLGRADEAETAYLDALRQDPGLADAHFNLSCLYEKRGDRNAALRHMIAYRERTS